ncbi:MAG: hypothetical protein ACE5K4_08605 [Candidatus Hydrothermarchaeota archaeon]
MWWSTDSGADLKQVEIEYVKKLEEELYEARSTCIIKITRAKEYHPSEPPEESTARITMKVNDALHVEEFDFEWV